MKSKLWNLAKTEGEWKLCEKFLIMLKLLPIKEDLNVLTGYGVTLLSNVKQLRH